MTFYLGTKQPAWLAKAAVPLMIPRRYMAERRKLPRAVVPWVLDSGAFMEITKHGRWTIAPTQYVAEVRRFASEVGRLEWAAGQDWMCEPEIIEKTGLSVAEHQSRSTANLLELRALAPELPWLPTLQGWTLRDYFAHLEAYERAGVDLLAEPVVGLGSVCRRQKTREIAAIIEAIASRGLRLHGFGVKIIGLSRIAPLLVSSDSQAWAYRARRAKVPLGVGCLGRHRTCTNCLAWALAWREHVLKRAATVAQLPLWEVA